MKRALIFCLLLCLLSPLQAQEDDEIFIPIHIGSQWQNEQVTALINGLTLELEAIREEFDEFTILIEQDPQFAMIEINLDYIEDTNAIFVDILPQRNPINMLPELQIVRYPFSEFPLVAQSDDPNWQQVTVDMIIAISAYNAGDCQTAYQAMNQVELGMEEIMTSSADVVFLGQLEQTITYLHFYRGNCALIEDDYELAAQYYEESLIIYDENNFDYRYGIDATINLAWTLYQLGETDEALLYLDDALASQFEGMQTAALMVRALIYAEEGDFESAYLDLEDAEKNPGDPMLINIERVQLLIWEGDFELALAEIDRLEKNPPPPPEALFLRGIIAYEEGDDDDALDYFDGYLELVPFGYLADIALEYIDDIESGS